MVSTTTALSLELESLLVEDIATAQQRQANALAQTLQSTNRPLVLFGAGHLGQKILSNLRANGLEPLAFADNNPAKWQTTLQGLPVLAPVAAAQAYGAEALFVVTISSPGHSYLKSAAQLRELGCHYVTSFLPLLWKYDAALPHYAFDLPHRLLAAAPAIRAAYALLADDLSRDIFVANLTLRLHANFERLPAPTLTDQYFPQALFAFAPTEIMIDGGAYDGDTLKEIIQRELTFKQIHCFEPDPLNYQKLTAYLATLPPTLQAHIQAYPLALSDTAGPVYFETSGTAGATINAAAASQVECVTLDEFWTGALPTYLKFDIEGAEQAALRGARNLIQQTQPLVAVCVYHCPADLWEIPLLLHTYYEQYRFFLRMHCEDGWDTVLYAVPPERTL